MNTFPILKNDLIIRAAKGMTIERVPVWLMGQVGRHLPEFLELKKKHGLKNIFMSPELVCELTLQPIWRYNVDAAIIFGDQLLIPEALGMEVQIKSKTGKTLIDPLKIPQDFKKLHQLNAHMLSNVYECINYTRHHLEGQVPLIGSTLGPWTIMSYMIEGHNTTLKIKAKKWLYKWPNESHRLLRILTKIVIKFLIGQAIAGAQLLQIFEHSVAFLTSTHFKSFVLPYLKKICFTVKSHLKREGYDIPLIILADAHYTIRDLASIGFDVISISCKISASEVRKEAGAITIQGNMDSCVLYSSEEKIKDSVTKMLQDFGTNNYIANLSQSVPSDADPKKVKAFVQAVIEYSLKDSNISLPLISDTPEQLFSREYPDLYNYEVPILKHLTPISENIIEEENINVTKMPPIEDDLFVKDNLNFNKKLDKNLGINDLYTWAKQFDENHMNQFKEPSALYNFENKIEFPHKTISSDSISSTDLDSPRRDLKKENSNFGEFKELKIAFERGTKYLKEANRIINHAVKNVNNEYANKNFNLLTENNFKVLEGINESLSNLNKKPYESLLSVIDDEKITIQENPGSFHKETCEGKVDFHNHNEKQFHDPEYKRENKAYDFDNKMHLMANKRKSFRKDFYNFENESIENLPNTKIPFNESYREYKYDPESYDEYYLNDSFINEMDPKQIDDTKFNSLKKSCDFSFNLFKENTNDLLNDSDLMQQKCPYGLVSIDSSKPISKIMMHGGIELNSSDSVSEISFLKNSENYPESNKSPIYKANSYLEKKEFCPKIKIFQDRNHSEKVHVIESLKPNKNNSNQILSDHYLSKSINNINKNHFK